LFQFSRVYFISQLHTDESFVVLISLAMIHGQWNDLRKHDSIFVSTNKKTRS